MILGPEVCLTEAELVTAPKHMTVNEYLHTNNTYLPWTIKCQLAMDEDEILALQSIYCMPGELEVIYEESKEARVAIQVQIQDGPKIKVVFNMSTAYPYVPPEISIFGEYLDKQSVKRLRAILQKHAEDNKGSPMVLDLISVLQEQASVLQKQTSTDYIRINTSPENSEPEVSTLLLHIDHMRARTQYVKTVKRWTEELGLFGRLFFCNKLILLLLQGDLQSLKEYMVRHKSVNIDVDSQGHPCKEKMMSILCEKHLPTSNRFVDFSVVECQSSKSLRTLFEEQKMEELFTDCVQTIKGFK